MTTLIKPQTLKGFRDFLPEEALKRQYAIDIIRKTFELYGFSPIETPALEYLETFTGSIGDGEKHFYTFTDNGGRKVALRYDQTVPSCRVIAQYESKITLPFKRYQIQTVWRAENTQKGRYREFLQCDADIFGSNDPLSDAETIALTIDIFKNLGFKTPLALVNDRALYQDIPYKAIVVIDKLQKIGKAGVIAELVTKGYSQKKAETLLESVYLNKPNQNLNKIFKYLDAYGMQANYKFSPTLARSFSYSTGTIWEIVVQGFDSGSLAGCERFDSLVSRFSNRQVPSVGFAIGFDRTILAMNEMNLFPPLKTNIKVLVTIFNNELLNQSQKITLMLRKNKINTELYSDSNEKLDKQIKYADKNGIPFVVIIGPDEDKTGKITVKDMVKKTQQAMTVEEFIISIKH